MSSFQGKKNGPFSGSKQWALFRAKIVSIGDILTYF